MTIDEEKMKGIFKDAKEEMAKAVSLKLEEKTSDVKKELEVSLEEKAKVIEKSLEDATATLEDKFNAHKQEIIELSTRIGSQSSDMSDAEKVQLEAFNACRKDGSAEFTLQDLRSYHEKLSEQIVRAASGEDIRLDASIAGYATYDDSKGGAFVVPVVDKNIRQDFVEHDMGLFNSITFEPAMSPLKTIVVDTVEPDENTAAVKESLEAISYTLDDGGFVTATMSLKDYLTPARMTLNQTEDSAFRIEPYVNNKLALGSQIKIAKDIWIGSGAKRIKGILNYEQGTVYGKVRVSNVATTGTVTMTDIMNLCIANKNKGVLYINRAAWGTAITEVDDNGRYLFEQGSVSANGPRPFHVDAYVPLLGVPVVFDDVFTLDEAVAADVVAAILPPSAIVGGKKPTARLTFQNNHEYKEIAITERYDAVLTKFNYVRLLLGTQA